MRRLSEERKSELSRYLLNLSALTYVGAVITNLFGKDGNLLFAVAGGFVTILFFVIGFMFVNNSMKKER